MWKSLIYVLILCFAGLAAVYTANPVIYAVLLLLLIGAAADILTAVFAGKQIQVSCITDVQQAPKTEIYQKYCSLQVENSSYLPIIGGQCLLYIQNMLTQEETYLRIPFAAAAKSKSPSLFVLESMYCGGLRIYVKEIVLGYVFPVHRKLTDTYAYTAMLPNVGDVVYDKMEAEVKNRDALSWSSQKSGYDPSEIFGIREYVPGDSVKFIHWKLSAKTESLMVKELGFPIENSFILLYETSIPIQIANIEHEEYCKMQEAKARNLAGISQYLIHNFCSHAIGFYNRTDNSFRIRMVGSEFELARVLTEVLGLEHAEDNKTVIDYYKDSQEDRYGNLIYIGYEISTGGGVGA